jgi:hypothetical protein
MHPCVGFAAFPPLGGQRQWPGKAGSTAFPVGDFGLRSFEEGAE